MLTLALCGCILYINTQLNVFIDIMFFFIFNINRIFNVLSDNMPNLFKHNFYLFNIWV